GAFVIDAMQHAAMMGVHFRPAGAFAVLGIPSTEFANSHVDVAALWGDGVARELRERLCTAPTHRARFQHLEGALIQRLAIQRPLNAVVPFGLECFGARRLWRLNSRCRATKRPQSSTVPDDLQIRSRTSTQGVLPHLTIPARSCGRATNGVHQLD